MKQDNLTNYMTRANELYPGKSILNIQVSDRVHFSIRGELDELLFRGLVNALKFNLYSNIEMQAKRKIYSMKYE